MKINKMFIGLGAVAVLGAAIVPMASYAASDSKNVNVALKVGSTISLSLTGTEIGPSIFNSSSSTDLTTVASVTTNSATGYSLAASTLSADGALVDGGISKSISYVGSSFASEDEGWALSVGGTYKDITDGNKINDLASSSTPVDGDSTTIGYNFKTAGDTVSGEYSTTLTYTATTN